MRFAFEGKEPKIDPSAFIAPTAVVIGDVTIGPRSSVWFNAVVRGDSSPISIGSGTCIQDNAVVHARTVIGDNCIVAHSAIVHGCTVGNNVLVGASAVIFDGCVVEDGAVVGMGAVLTPNTHVSAGTIMVGLPAQPVGDLTPEQMKERKDPEHFYVQLARRYLASGALKELELG